MKKDSNKISEITDYPIPKGGLPYVHKDKVMYLKLSKLEKEEAD